MNTEAIKKVILGSHQATMTFPQVVQTLLAEGFEAYHVDLVRNENRYYMPNGESHVEIVAEKHAAPAADFSAAMVEKAIRSIQAGQINYREFIRQILEAGTVAYAVYLDGKRAIYFGRKGEFHVEHFPDKKL